jgi:AraC family transcriptional regulator of arabinose operon
VVFGDVTYHPRGSCGPRIQSDFQLVLVHAGEAVITVDSAEHLLPAGHVALLRPGRREYLEFSRTETTHHTWCSVHPRRVSASLGEELEAAAFSLPMTERLQTLLELGLSTPVADLPVMSDLVDSLGETLLREYLAQATLGRTGSDRLPVSLRRAMEMVKTQFAGPLDVAQLAKAACCSPNHLGRLFREHLGITPARYLWRTRVSRAVELLGQTGLSVSEIADRTGFQTPFHLSRLVKQQHRLAPKEIRARTWNLDRSTD